MHFLPATVATTLLLLLLSITTTTAHNITDILASHPEFSTFNNYLTLTHLADEINRRTTITVCAVDNADMADLTAKHLSIYAIKNVLSLHILLDYFDAKKLHQINNGTALAATAFQATGAATGASGFVNITDLKGGKVGFGAQDNDGNLDAVFVKTVETLPYNISVIHISKVIRSTEAEAPTPAPSQVNLTALMSKQGCKVFADTLSASDSLATFTDNAEGGLTVFCPIDDVFKQFLPKYKNLTSEAKASLLLYHGIPIYESIPMLKSSNGLTNTLATDGAHKFDFDVQNDGETVTLKTKVDTAKITGTLLDEQPLAIYTINKVLLPRELFNVTEAPAPAPAPVVVADSPKGRSDASDSPAGGPVADQVADDNASAAAGFTDGKFVAVMLSLWFGVVLLS